MKNKIIEAFRNYRDSPTKEGTSFIEEVQFAEGFYYGHKSRDEEIEELKEELRIRNKMYTELEKTAIEDCTMKDEYRYKNATMRRDSKYLQAEIKKLKDYTSCNSKLVAEIEALKAEIESYKQSAGIVAESYMRKEAEINKLKGELKGMEIAFDIKQEEIEELRECIADTKQYQAGYRSGVKSQQAEIKKLKEGYLRVRDALILGDTEEAYHTLYKMADPEFKSNHPWKEWEALKDGK